MQTVVHNSGNSSGQQQATMNAYLDALARQIVSTWGTSYGDAMDIAKSATAQDDSSFRAYGTTLANAVTNVETVVSTATSPNRLLSVTVPGGTLQGVIGNGPTPLEGYARYSLNPSGLGATDREYNFKIAAQKFAAKTGAHIIDDTHLEWRQQSLELVNKYAFSYMDSNGYKYYGMEDTHEAALSTMNALVTLAGYTNAMEVNGLTGNISNTLGYADSYRTLIFAGAVNGTPMTTGMGSDLGVVSHYKSGEFTIWHEMYHFLGKYEGPAGLNTGDLTHEEMASDWAWARSYSDTYQAPTF